MEIAISKGIDNTIVKVEGRVDTTTAKDFETEVQTVLQDAECTNVIVDCAGLSYVSSSGLRVFLVLQKGMNAKKGKLVLKNMNAPIKEVFKITGFASIFTIE